MFDTNDFDALRRLGLHSSLVSQALSLSSDPADRLMRVTEVQRDRCTLHDGHAQHEARLWPALQARLQLEGDSLTVGDWVLMRPERPEAGWVVAVLPPDHRLVRRDPSGQRQALVSHVDHALLVMTCGHDFNLRRLDRYLALVRLAEVDPVVVLTQADCHPAPQARVAAVRQHLGPAGAAVPVLALDGRSPQAAQALAPWLQPGRTLVLLGSSGAGKSTLLNTLVGPTDGDVQRTGAARVQDGRGRHTTTARSLHRCPSGACVIDTPGLRGLQLDADEAELARAFDDIGQLATQCRFRDCQHQDEPGCAVRGQVAPARLLSWHKLQREARRQEQDALQRREQQAQWKARSKATREVMRIKRG
ncbi:ribosome small subunit-dependent GTPase A [Ideonella sp. B7]|uniref:ribosome small subunit-dependent GTPase A n=1 Tax=Ideonella benzenivorans TaxID=2831643 RepID=UPI001CED470D|nr:ribosome small subunit-dependent GTPase A [Ideonella benzenivorans]MCA6217745.1 ribosome small subunit-dependent GTPase A [Ideonella benzenivorans]